MSSNIDASQPPFGAAATAAVRANFAAAKSEIEALQVSAAALTASLASVAAQLTALQAEVAALEEGVSGDFLVGGDLTVTGTINGTISDAESVPASGVDFSGSSMSAGKSDTMTLSAGLFLKEVEDSDYTLILSDAGVQLDLASAGDVTISIPEHADVLFETGATIVLQQMGQPTSVTFQVLGGVQLLSFDELTQISGTFGVVYLQYKGDDVWTLVGALV